MRAADFPRTFRTIRYLRPSQIPARGSFILERAVARRRPGILSRVYARKVRAVEPDVVDADPIWRWPPAPLDPLARAENLRAQSIIQGQFTFLNQTRVLQPEAMDWSPAGASRLWLFHLHSFSYAVDLAASSRLGNADAYAAFRALLMSWLDAHPVGPEDPWHPFVASSRLIALCVARDALRGRIKSDAVFAKRLRESVLFHACYVGDHLETDVGGNHLLKNLTALMLAGCAFQGPGPEAWRRAASAGFALELPRQILADGGHYERAPMYHLLVLEDLLSALFVAGKRDLSISSSLAHAVRRMQSFGLGLVHPDGDIPLFNDSVLGEAPPPRLLAGPATLPAGPAFPDTGYFLLPANAGSDRGVMIVDCGPPGPDDLPAHVHADALSFEVSVGGQRVLVDGGVEGYERTLSRSKLRGTPAHNTVEVDGQNQSEVWGVFRVGRRATVWLERWVERPEGNELVGSHSGYSRLGARHERQVNALNGSGWRVLDTIAGSGFHLAASRLHLHPLLHWSQTNDAYVAQDEQGELLLKVVAIGRPLISIESGLTSQRFSEPRPTSTLCLTREGQAPFVFGYWLLLPQGRMQVA